MLMFGQLSYQKNSRFKTSLTWKGTQSVWGRTRSGWGRTRSGWGRTRSSSVEVGANSVGANSVGANSSWGETGINLFIDPPMLSLNLATDGVQNP